MMPGPNPITTTSTDSPWIFRWSDSDIAKGMAGGISRSRKITDLESLGTYQWYRKNERGTLRSILPIFQRIIAADSGEPVLLDHRGVIITGHEQICRAHVDRVKEVRTIQLTSPVPPAEVIHQWGPADMKLDVDSAEARLRIFEHAHSVSRRSSPRKKSNDVPVTRVRGGMFIQDCRSHLKLWYVGRLWDRSEDLPVSTVRISDIPSIGHFCWKSRERGHHCVSEIAYHLRKCENVDLSYPPIMMPNGMIMDGMHRLANRMLSGETMVEVKQFSPENLPPHDELYVRWAGDRIRFVRDKSGGDEFVPGDPEAKDIWKTHPPKD